MAEYIAKRILLIIPTLFGITIVTFLILQAMPGDAAQLRVQAGPLGMSSQNAMTQEIIEQTRALYGLDKPYHVQYVLWVSRMIRLDFGKSFKDGRPVWDKIVERLPITLTLNIISLIIVYTVSFPVAIYTALRQDGAVDRASAVVLFAMYSIPGFWLGLLLITYLASNEYYDWFPAYGLHSDGYEMWTLSERLLDYTWHLVLPIIVYTTGSFAFMARFGRTAMLEKARLDFVRTARAKGLSEKTVVAKHIARNAAIPIVTLFAGLLPGLLGGSIIIEGIFSIQGLGLLAFEALKSHDLPTMMGFLVIVSFLTLLGLLITDILYKVIDPRITFTSLERS